MDENATARTSEASSATLTRPVELPRVWLTWLLIAANVLVYVVMAFAVGNFISFPTLALLAWGGNFAPGVADGEFWRPVTAMFLHAGLIHLGLNMWVLSTIGPFLERLFGVTTFLLIYLLAGLSGSVASLAWNPATVGVGASGAIFGLYGALVGFLFVRRRVIPADVLNPLLQNGLYFLGINLVLGFTIPNVDVAAHLGGAVSGFLGGLAATWQMAQTPRSAWLVRNALLLLLIALVAAATPLFLPAATPAQGQLVIALQGLQESEPDLFKRFNELIREHSHDEDGKAFADQLEKEVLEPWQTMSARFPPLEDLPRSQPSKPMTAPVYQYLKMMEEAFSLTVAANRNGDEEAAKQADNKMRQAQKLIDAMRASRDQ